MNATFKRKIINHPLLYKLIVNLVNARYFFANTSKIKGRNNRIEFKEGVLKLGKKSIKIKNLKSE